MIAVQNLYLAFSLMVTMNRWS